MAGKTTQSDIDKMDAEMEAEQTGNRPEEARDTTPEPAPKRAAKEEPEIEFVAEDDDKSGDKDQPRAEDGKFAAKDAKKSKEERAKEREARGPDDVPENLRVALHTERSERKKAEEILQQERIRQARLEERLNLINEALAKQAQKPAQDSDPIPAEDDIVGRQEWLIRQNESRRHQEAEQHQQWQRQQTEQQETAQIVSVADQQWGQYRQQNPNADNAYEYLKGARRQQLMLLGTPSHLVDAQLRDEVTQLARAAYTNGRHISDLIMGYAHSYGWREPVPEPTEQATPNGKANDSAEKLTRLAKAQEASESLSNSGGSSPAGNRISLESLDRMDNKEFHNLINSLHKKGGEDSVNRALAKMHGI